jgi:hypothetical protein
MFLATHTGILTSARSTSPHGLASQLTERSPTEAGMTWKPTPESWEQSSTSTLGRYVSNLPTSRSFGARLEPRYIVGAESLDQ